MDQLHRKRIRHYHEPGHLHLLTFSCYQRLPLLANDEWKTSRSQCLDQALDRHEFGLVAFVFMPEHVHLLVWPRRTSYRVDKLLAGVKRPVSYRVGQSLRVTQDPLLDRLTVRERPGVTRFCFWQEGAGHDRNLTSPEAAAQATEYIHHNPVRRGFCENPEGWRWSSWRHYERPDDEADPALPRVHGFPR